MDPIQPISPAVQNLPAVEPVHRRVDPDEQKVVLLIDKR